MNSDNAFALGYRRLGCAGCVGRSHFLTDHAGRRFAAKGVHVLHKSAQFRKFLDNLWRSDECTFAPANLDQTAAHKILDSPANGNTTDSKSRNEAVFGGQLATNLQ